MELTKKIEAKYKTIAWKIPPELHKEFVADLFSIAWNHEDQTDEWWMLVTLSIERWYNILPEEIRELVDKNDLSGYDIQIE